MELVLSCYHLEIKLRFSGLMVRILSHQLGVVVHASDPSTREAEAGKSSEFEANLVYRASSRTARAT